MEDRIKVNQEKPDVKEDKASGTCTGIKKFGKDFANAKDKTSDGSKISNLAFMSNFQITLQSEAVKSKQNDNFVGSLPNNKISRAIACAKGKSSPVLDKPITIEDLKKIQV
jgi:hypothetical protein